MTNFEKVGLFMKTFGQDIKTSASFSSKKITELRVSLIEEELKELKELWLKSRKEDVSFLNGSRLNFIKILDSSIGALDPLIDDSSYSLNKSNVAVAQTE